MEEMTNRTEEYIKEIEYKASMKFNVVKLVEDNYVIAANIVNTNLIESQDFKSSNFYKNEELKKLIYKLEVSEGDFISVSCKAIDEEGRVIVDIINMKEPERIFNIALESKFEHQDREMLVMMIADSHKEVEDVYVSFYVGCNFEDIESLVNSEDQ